MIALACADSGGESQDIESAGSGGKSQDIESAGSGGKRQDIEIRRKVTGRRKCWFYSR